MSPQYIDHIAGGNWFVFGLHTDGHVDVADTSRELFVHVSKETAAAVIEARDRFLKELHTLLEDADYPHGRGTT